MNAVFQDMQMFGEQWTLSGQDITTCVIPMVAIRELKFRD